MRKSRSDRSLQRISQIVQSGCERRVEQIRRGAGKEPKEMDPFSFKMTSVSCVQKSRDGVTTSRGAVDGLGGFLGAGILVGFVVNAASPGRQTGWGLNLCWFGALSWE